MKIKSIIFDLDGVIIDSLELNMNLYRDLAKSFCHYEPSREMLIEAHKHTFKENVEKLMSVKSESDFKKVLELSKKINSKYVNDTKLTKDCKKVLEILSKKFKLAIVTGRYKSSTMFFLDKFDISKFFDAVVCRDDYEKPKPDAESLVVAMKKMKLAPEETVYVGDNEIDIGSARAAGVKIIIFSDETFPDADFCTNSLKDVEKAVHDM